jgi:hypothetical protein
LIDVSAIDPKAHQSLPMIVRLGTRPRPPAPPSSAIDFFLECHGRIRHFTALAAKLPDAPPEKRPEAASLVQRFFSIGLPLHATDEDVSLAPRLRLALAGAPSSAVVADALDAMTAEHPEVDALGAAIAEICATIAARPDATTSLAADVARLSALWDEHLAREEEIIFPAARLLLPAEAQAIILEECRSRRASPAFLAATMVVP